MLIKTTKPFFFEAGKRAVLLLHGFTGNSADVRMLGRFLEKNGYTSLAPHYKGHGVPPEELMQTGPTDWWEDVEDGYESIERMQDMKKLQLLDFTWWCIFIEIRV